MCLQMWRACRPGLQKCPNPTKSQPKWANGAPGMPDWSIIFQNCPPKNTLICSFAATVASTAGKRANLVQPGPAKTCPHNAIAQNSRTRGFCGPGPVNCPCALPPRLPWPLLTDNRQLCCTPTLTDNMGFWKCLDEFTDSPRWLDEKFRLAMTVMLFFYCFVQRLRCTCVAKIRSKLINL